MPILSNHNGPLAAVARAAIIEEFWASRNAWADAMNAERRAAWEGKWAGIQERDLAPGHARRVEARVESRVLPLRRKQEESEDHQLPASAPGYRFYWQPKSLQIPLP